jgi:NAD(P)H-hydrate epimerase
MQNLPEKLYKVESVVKLEQIAINQFAIPGYELMKRAGMAVYQVLDSNYTRDNKILVLCGAGNNAGDGYVVAKLASENGFEVRVISLIDPEALKAEASLAYQDWLDVGHISEPELAFIEQADIIVDALLGTGLTRDVSGRWAEWITAVNRSSRPVIAVDVPSGLIADTGSIAGVAIRADTTVCFIGLKQGMFTAQANDVCGEIMFNDLDLHADVYRQVTADAVLLRTVDYSLLSKRKASSNKGNFGHVLIVGGNTGMPGAVILAARAALRAGAGLVTVVTVADNLAAVCSAVPEAMVRSCQAGSISGVLTEQLVNSVTHVAIGVGLGQDDWSLSLLCHCIELNKTMLVDADALNLMAKHGLKVHSPLVITPHPGEAARLLSAKTTFSSADVQRDRFDAVNKLYDMFAVNDACTVILKGSGTLIFDGKTLKICSLGSAAMAAPGMGDVLSGIVVALMAQGINISDAGELAVCLHASAAMLMVGEKTRGLLASDVIDALPEVLL